MLLQKDHNNLKNSMVMFDRHFSLIFHESRNKTEIIALHNVLNKFIEYLSSAIYSHRIETKKYSSNHNQ